MKQLLLAFLIFSSISSIAQIAFVDSSLTWEQLAKKAKDENKLVFIHVEGSGCEQCNTVATQGFSSPILKEKFAKNFVSTRVNIESKNGLKFAEKFKIPHPLISLFVDADGNVLHKYVGSTSSGITYAQQADMAISKIGQKPFAAYEKQYEAGERSPAFIREFITRQKEMQMPIDRLLDEYAGMLTIDSLQNFETVKFIYKQSPTVDSRIYKAIQAVTPRKIIDSIYKNIPYPEAVAINNGIIGSTFRKAVKTKDQNLVFQLSSFIQGTYGNDYEVGYMASQRNLNQYMHAIKDTAQYIMGVSNFINHHYMMLSVDSLKRIDAKQLARQPKTQHNGGPGVTSSVVSFPPPSQFYHIELNEHAWHFYEMSNRKSDLEKALMWSKKSIEWFDELNKGKNHPMTLGNPAYLDTYAHLLYKLGHKEEAIVWQTKAVEASKAAKQPFPTIEKELAKMKAGTL
ncbi:thioredoxin family protein [Dyadobacter sp. CY326]|uniref:thioredoxin family protein n=1 Tax=Dyadobacter sp. CY326 TaxID=2907300 RepID=UPI001F3D56BA|nr:thioredoxin family protein [Dyadobacter sp. CY326]MCE7064567.1 thioredoxin family protein [Dyadobacter sp. CY326]